MGTDPQPLTLAEFLAWEARQPAKYEFRDGAIFAMACASDDHGQIVLNLCAIIRPALRGTVCRAYPLDMNVVTLIPARAIRICWDLRSARRARRAHQAPSQARHRGPLD